MKKFFNRLLLILSYAVVAVLSGLAVFIVDRIPPNMGGCVADQHVISRNARGDEVEMHQDICGGFVYSDTVTLSVIMNKSGERGEFFSYERNDSEPIITWIRDDILEVNIQKTGEVYKKKDHFGGITIRYSDRAAQ